MPIRKECTGVRFGLLVVISETPAKSGVRRKALCKCDCGEYITIDPRSLFSGHTRSCGCYHKMVVSVATIKNHTTHGMSRSKEYNTWCHIKSRCNNKRNKKYKDYGGAGVSVSKEWMNSFAVFLADMGNAPSKAHSIERIDVFGDYCKENCKWALPIEQGRNKRRHRLVEYNGETMPLSQACEVTGVNYRGALYRVNNDKHWMPIPQPPKFTE